MRRDHRCDAEADPQSAFGSLTEALRQIYIDENIRVEINLDRLEARPGHEAERRNWAIGTIYYPQMSAEAGCAARRHRLSPRAQVILRGGADDSEPVKNYRQEHPEFPTRPPPISSSTTINSNRTGSWESRSPCAP